MRFRNVYRVAASLAATFLLLIALLYILRPVIHIRLDDRLIKSEGHSYIALLPDFARLYSVPEDEHGLFRDAALYLGAESLGPGGSSHQSIREHGNGRWSYWGRHVYLSPPKAMAGALSPGTGYALRLRFDPPISPLLVAGTALTLTLILLACLVRLGTFAHLLRRRNFAWPAISCDYSPEIDGLRALAVLSVVFYHFDVPHFSGGFIGVDIFFVISGYLISRLLLRDLAANSFTFSHFYLRRTRRIFPALIATLIFSSLFALLLQSPSALISYGNSLASTALFLSNFYFFSEAGYFDASASTKPLLHTWSLGVEEQFYLAYPALLAVCRRLTRFRTCGLFILALSVLSFAGGAHQMTTDATAAFFISPYRFYEFGFGALLVFLEATAVLLRTSTSVSAAGLGLVLYSLFSFNHDTSFPGLNAVPVCLGTTLLILSRNSRLAAMLFGNTCAVRIGLLSFSLYLVHWPLVVFYQSLRLQTGTLVPSEWIALTLLTMGLGYALHRFVEVPFRHPRTPGRRGNTMFAIGVLFSLLLLAALGLGFRAYNGVPERLPPLIRKNTATPLEAHHKYVWARFNQRKGPFANDGRQKMLIIGDSQAADFVNIIEEATSASIDIATLLVNADCQSVIPRDSTYYDLLPIEPAKVRQCQNQHKSLMRDQRIREADVIVIGSLWKPYGISEISDTLKRLEARTGARIIILGLKQQSMSGVEFLIRSRWRFEAPEALAYRMRRTDVASLNDEVRRSVGDHWFVDLQAHLCDSSVERCAVTDQAGNALLCDASHLTRSGAKYVARQMLASRDFDFLTDIARR